ncbi:hypothetical protein BO70DRAFT_58819 [Aspergillus heteromorphus CBS 117.55]|uniref:Uncharacterized protein n=1 Tax=Aspergillus heteromorphus CBS 117.55 TaxID=1448321 RepID=A0A317VYG4_9EURO|nr:uncharacterized protein BO70DRAFT_58819 [Aspergillus heteromorphus CBS 117.55]PWY79313.1 hypothetical protein BO70DRAFT_58819 [Aspergillus heteromorphus CBS 117.55]
MSLTLGDAEVGSYLALIARRYYNRLVHPTEPKTTVRRLPNDIFVIIGKFADYQSLSRMSQTCHGLQDLFEKELKSWAKAHALPAPEIYEMMAQNSIGPGVVHLPGTEWANLELSDREILYKHFPHPLFEAVSASRYDVVKAYLDAGVSPDSCDVLGYPLLFDALNRGVDISILKLLLQYGADVHVKSLFNDDSVLKPFKWGYPTSRLFHEDDVGRILLEAGAVVPPQGSMDIRNRSLLKDIICSESSVYLLGLIIKNGTDMTELFALHLVAGYGSLETLEALLEYAPDLLNSTDSYGNRVLERRSWPVKRENALFLIQKGIKIRPLHRNNSHGNSVLARYLKDKEILQALLALPEMGTEEWDAEYSWCISELVLSGDIETLKLLLGSWKQTAPPQIISLYRGQLVLGGKSRASLPHHIKIYEAMKQIAPLIDEDAWFNESTTSP